VPPRVRLAEREHPERHPERLEREQQTVGADISPELLLHQLGSSDWNGAIVTITANAATAIEIQSHGTEAT